MHNYESFYRFYKKTGIVSVYEFVKNNQEYRGFYQKLIEAENICYPER